MSVHQVTGDTAAPRAVIRAAFGPPASLRKLGPPGPAGCGATAACLGWCWLGQAADSADGAGPGRPGKAAASGYLSHWARPRRRLCLLL